VQCIGNTVRCGFTWRSCAFRYFPGIALWWDSTTTVYRGTTIVKKMITTCWWMIEHLFHTITVIAIDEGF